MAKTDTKKNGSDRLTIGELIKDIVIAVVIAFIIVQFIKPTIVMESSMEPNFYERDYLLVSRMAYKFDKMPQKGDVIIFKSDLETKNGKKKLLIKRVIGLPGDEISIHDGMVSVNGELDDQSYTSEGVTSGDMDVTVPEDELFCMGDNRPVSVDSRSGKVGCIEMSRVVGKAVFRAFPFNKIGKITNPYQE